MTRLLHVATAAFLVVGCSQAPVDEVDLGPCGPDARLFEGNCVLKVANCEPPDQGILADVQNWAFTGATTYDATQNWLVITSATKFTAGSAFQTAVKYQGSNINIAFEFKIDGGDGGDGFALVALNAAKRKTDLLGPTGCGMGFGNIRPCCVGPSVGDATCTANTVPLPGWAVEFDTFNNPTVDQTGGPHIGFAIDGDLKSEPMWAPVPNLRGVWHKASVTVLNKSVKVTLDNKVYLNKTISQDLNFPAWVGFTGSTGNATDNHLVRGLSVTLGACAK